MFVFPNIQGMASLQTDSDLYPGFVTSEVPGFHDWIFPTEAQISCYHLSIFDRIAESGIT
jgi:hypothetical protein